MKCKCKAKPKPEVTWYRGTTVVKESAKIKMNIIDVEEDIYELTIELKVNHKINYFILEEIVAKLLLILGPISSRWWNLQMSR